MEALRHEMESRAAVHLDRVAGVVGEHVHRSVVGRLVAPPATPILAPLAPNGAEHVSAHDICTPALEQIAARALVSLVSGLARVEMPIVQRQAADAERVLPTLVGTRDEAVERDGVVTCDSAHTLKTANPTPNHRRVWICELKCPRAVPVTSARTGR